MNTLLMDMAEQAMSKSMMQLMRSKNQAYITCVLLNLPRVFCNSMPTAGVNGVEIRVNPKFFLDLSEGERKFLLVHEAWHIGLFDIIRGKGKDHQVWNIACDHYINLMIDAQKDSSLSFIEGGCMNSKYSGWEKEDIYQDLLKKSSSEPQGALGSDLMPELGEGTPTQQEAATKALEQQISNIVQQAAMQTKMMGGEVPPEVSSYLDKLYNPKLPWERLLVKYVSETSNDDYSYRRINKTFFPHGMILPTLYGEGLGRIAIANDSSGSVSNKEFQTYLGAIKDIKDRLNPSQIDVVNFTTRIEEQWSIQQDEDIQKIQFRSSGGTDLSPVFHHFNRPENQPEVLIVFSDLECTPITKRPAYDVIWIVVNNSGATTHFGRKIHIEV